MNRPDYHALHHHIATPTGKWLELIANPQAFDVTISEGKQATSRKLAADPIPQATSLDYLLSSSRKLGSSLHQAQTHHLARIPLTFLPNCSLVHNANL